jgi:hypothetical protein
MRTDDVIREFCVWLYGEADELRLLHYPDEIRHPVFPSGFDRDRAQFDHLPEWHGQPGHD